MFRQSSAAFLLEGQFVSVLIYGCGYLGLRAARLWLKEGRQVWAVTRTLARADELRQVGVQPLVADPVAPPPRWRPPPVQTVLISLGFDRTAGQTIDQVYSQGTSTALNASPEASCWIYISTTGVYGETDGQTLDETAECRPSRPGGRASLQAEDLLRQSGRSAWILRMAGLYGPGRIPRAADLRAGRPLPTHPDSLLNLIHVDDAARAVVAASKTVPEGCEIVHLSDGQPVRRADFYQYAAGLLGAETPRFDTQSAANARGGPGGKRILNKRMFQRLLPKLTYPSYREGLRQALDCESQ